MTLTQILIIGFILMTAVALAAIIYGFKLVKKYNSYSYRQQAAYDFLKEERKKAGLQ
ncbi:hypothetical protein ACVR1I_08600 [Streptococcus cameli]